MTDSDAERRVWARLPDGARDLLNARLPQADLNALLLGVARQRAAAVAPGRLLRRWTQDRFVRPADADPRVLAALEARIWRLLPAEVDGVELSPVAPLGTCSAVAPVSQNRIVTTMRGTEVVSDSTNALAIEAAARRLQDRRRKTAGAETVGAATGRPPARCTWPPATGSSGRRSSAPGSPRTSASSRSSPAPGTPAPAARTPSC